MFESDAYTLRKANVIRKYELSLHKTDEFFEENLKSIIYGGLDGIITTFAVVAGVQGANLSTEVLLLSLIAIIMSKIIGIIIKNINNSPITIFSILFNLNVIIICHDNEQNKIITK